MANWPLPSAFREIDWNTSVNLLPITNIVCSATPHVKGAWTEITAAAPVGVNGFWLQFETIGNSSAATPALLDLGIGAAGSEIGVLSNLVVGFQSIATGPTFYPMAIPAGARLAGRAQGGIASDIIPVTIVWAVGEQGFHAARRMAVCDSYGADTSISGGTILGLPATGGAFGAWTEITPTTINEIHTLEITGQLPPTTTAATAANLLVEVGVGAAGLEIPVSKAFFETSTSELILRQLRSGVESHSSTMIKAGSRVSARYMGSNSVNARPNIVLHGFRR
jgi:hypothetical protein